MPYERDKRLDSTDWIVLLLGFLGALKIFLASLPEPYAIRIEDATISALVNTIAFGVVLFGVVKGNIQRRRADKSKNDDM